MTNLAMILVWTNLVTGLCEWTGDRQTAINSGYAYSTSAVMPDVAIAPAPEMHMGGIITPILYMPSTPSATNGFSVAVQPDGSVDTEHWYGSPTNTPEEIKAAFDQKHRTRTVANSNKLTRIERIAVDLQQVDASISNINVSAGTWANTNQRAAIVSIKVAVRNLMQATEKVRKEIEP